MATINERMRTVQLWVVQCQTAPHVLARSRVFTDIGARSPACVMRLQTKAGVIEPFRRPNEIVHQLAGGLPSAIASTNKP